MDQKILFIADHLRGGCSHSALCARYGISRRTGYKWVDRYRQFDLDGLDERSRRPQQSPFATPYLIRQAIIELRGKGRVPLGAKKILALLKLRYPEHSLPSKSTVYNILNAEGLIEKRKRSHRVRRYPHPLAGANELWSTDYKGQCQLGSGKWCYPLTVMDHHSRYLLGCHGVTGTGTGDARAHFTGLFRKYGLPQRIRSDNGTPFASRAPAGLSALSIWWIHLGIVPERIEPGKPQQNGRHERMHRTLKQATMQIVASSPAAQQRRFDAFRKTYNHERPYEALGQTTPASHYHISARKYPEVLPEVEYPGYFEIKGVSSNGVIYVHNDQVYVSNLLVGERVGMDEVDDGVWDVYFGPVRLGGFNLRDKKGGQTPYWTIKV